MIENMDKCPLPEARDSCLGCKYSHDSACTYPDENQLTEDEQRELSYVLEKVNNARKQGRPVGAEYRRSNAPC